MTFTLADLTGPVAALALLLLMLGGFMSGRILPRNTVPREDYDGLLAVNANYSVIFGQQTEAIGVLTTGYSQQVDEIRGLRIEVATLLASRPASRR